jgi:hypothetical protein
MLVTVREICSLVSFRSLAIAATVFDCDTVFPSCDSGFPSLDDIAVISSWQGVRPVNYPEEEHPLRILGFEITRLKRGPDGQFDHPWQLVTMDQLSPQARQLIAKMARAAARDYFDQLREDERVVSGPPHGRCIVCRAQFDPLMAWHETSPGYWEHSNPQDCMEYLAVADGFPRHAKEDRR